MLLTCPKDYTKINERIGHMLLLGKVGEANDVAVYLVLSI